MNDIETEYPTFNGLNRQAMIFGVPLIPFMACFFVLMMLFMVAMTFLGGKSLFILLLVIPIFLGANDNSKKEAKDLRYCFHATIPNLCHVPKHAYK